MGHFTYSVFLGVALAGFQIYTLRRFNKLDIEIKRIKALIGMK